MLPGTEFIDYMPSTEFFLICLKVSLTLAKIKTPKTNKQTKKRSTENFQVIIHFQKKKKKRCILGMVAHAFSPSIQGVNTGISLEFGASLVYIQNFRPETAMD